MGEQPETPVLVLTRTGRIPEAIQAFEEALRLQPNDARAKSELTRLRGGAN